MKENLEKRMYFIVPYNISEIQKGIQAGHAALEFAYEYKNDFETWEFIENHKTWIILNGGTTNNEYELGTGNAVGTLNQCVQDISNFNFENPNNIIKYSVFQEPDLNNALTAICLIVDERVFNRKDYPDFDWWVAKNDMFIRADDKENWDNAYEAFKEEVGEDIAFLKKLLNTKKLA
jgi:hypothetical protein